ncbi:hypothetical protein G6024_04900 [Dietzia maris]|nr:hypothetical protein [Dietzia maris]MBB0996445.1 hypothetical protein [Dietzia maris]
MGAVRLPGGLHFWSFGAFPVIASAAFQIAIIVEAAESLGSFFVLQSVVAIGISLACLQPRTWNEEFRVPAHLRWSFIFSLMLIGGVGIYFILRPSSLGLVVAAFLAKKVCDVGREFAFLADLRMPAWSTGIVTVLEVVGVLVLLPGFVLLSTIMYAVAGVILASWTLWAARGESWAVKWTARLIPHAVSMTLFNMGSRVFLVFASGPAAHLTIGSILQVVNFLSPVTYFIFSRSRGFFPYLLGWLFCASAIVGGGFLFIQVGGGSGASYLYILAFGCLLAFNSSAVVRFSAYATGRSRLALGALVSCWVGIGALLAMAGFWRWEVSFLLFLIGNAGILGYFVVRSRFTAQLTSVRTRLLRM